MKFVDTDRPTSEWLGGLLIAGLVLLGMLGWLWQSYSAPSHLTSALPTSTYPAFAPASPLALAGTPLPLLGAPISADNASQVVQLARWGEGTIYGATWSPAGTLLATATSLGVSLYDAQTLQPVKFLETGVAINQVVFSPDGTLLAGAGADFAVWVWQVQAGTLRHKLTWHTAQVSSLAFSADGSLLASGSADQTVRLWRVADGELLHTLNVPAIELDPDQPLEASLTTLKSPAFAQQVLGTETMPVTDVAFSPDGNLVVAGVPTGHVPIWRVEDGTLVRTLPSPEPKWMLWQVAFDPSGTNLTAVADDASLAEWQVNEGTLLRSRPKPAFSSVNVAFAPDGASLALAGVDGAIQVQRLSDGQVLSILASTGGSLQDAAFAPAGTHLAVALADGLQVWRLADCGAKSSQCQPLLQTQTPHLAALQSVAFSQDGQKLAAGTDDTKAWLWRVTDGTLLETLTNHVVPIQTGLRPVSSTTNDPLTWPTSPGLLVRTPAKGIGALSIKVLSPDRSLLAVAELPQSLQVVRVSDGTILHEFPSSIFVNSLAFSPDGATLAEGDSDGLIRLWPVDKEGEAQTWQASQSGITALAFSPDGSLLAAGSMDMSLQLWRVADQSLQHSLANKGSVLSLVFSPDGSVLAVASYGETIELWRVADGMLLHSLAGHFARVTSVAFSADGRLLASGAVDGTVRLWGVHP